MPEHLALPRRIGTLDAVLLGLGAMLGAGVFTALAPATAAAGRWLVLALALAAVVATCNAFSSAGLAAAYPESGGSYVYATALLGRWPGRVAGVAFLTGKTCSAAAAAGTLGVYLVPRHAPLVAVLAVCAVTAVNVVGVRWTVGTTRVLVGTVLTVLAAVVAVGLLSPASPPPAAATAGAGPFGLLTAAGVLFFAFAGYARIATLGEEVRDPARTLRLAIPLALAIILVVYLLIAFAALRMLGPAGLATSTAPLADVVARSPAAVLTPMVRAGAAVAMVSVLLTVLVGISRTALAMARRADLPRSLARIGRRGTPWRADLAVGTITAVIAVLAGPVAAITLSACSVLVYYAITNAAALRLRATAWRWPGWTAWLGLVGCTVLAVSLPPRQVLITVTALAAGTVLIGLIGWRAHRYGATS